MGSNHVIRASRSHRRRLSSPGGEWWEIAGQTAVAAYQPKGAASLAASYTDLTGNGNDAAPGVAPTWNATDGWIFNGTTQYLVTGVVPTRQLWSAFVRFTNGSTDNNRYLFGAFNASGSREFGIVPHYGPGGVLYISGNSLAAGVNATSGLFGIAGNRGYRNGSQESGTIPAGSGTITAGIYVGARNRADIASVDSFLAGRIQALVIYSTTLSAGDASTLTDNMNAL